MSTDFEKNLVVLTEHINEVAGRQVTAAGTLKIAGETVNDLADGMWGSHGVVCSASNLAAEAFEAARDDARSKLWHMSDDLGARLQIASANYSNADWRASKDIGTCEL